MYDVNEALVELDALCMSFCLTANDHRHCYEEKGPKWELVVYWDNPVGGDEYLGEPGESVGDLVLRALRDPDRLVYESVRRREAARYGDAGSKALEDRPMNSRQLTLNLTADECQKGPLQAVIYACIDDYDLWMRTHDDTEAFPGSDY